MCNQKPSDILNGIVEKGPMFSKSEYSVLLKLLQRSDPNVNSNALTKYEEKLADIMKQVGVAV